MIGGWLRSRGIGGRLWLGYGFALVLLVATGALDIERLDAVQRQADVLVNEHVHALDVIGHAQETASQRAVLLRDLVLNDNLQAQREALARLQANARDHEAALEALRGLGQGDRRGRVDAPMRLAEQAGELEKRTIAMVAEARYDEAKEMLASSVTPRHEAVNAELRKLFAGTMAEARDAVASNRRSNEAVMGVVLAATLGAAAFAAAMAFFVTRSITRPVAEATELALQVKRGDLARPISSASRDEIGTLIATLEAMRASLEGQVATIRAVAANVGHASERILRGSGDLAERTSEEAAGLEETAASMEELTTTVKQNADNAAQAADLAHGSSAIAGKGGEAMRDIIQTMQGILESSSKIHDIVSVIDSIAFQTNILALNAAVEAARAGEQGRGFAVVATEVRSLAQRSASAAREIKGLIDESSRRIGGGARQIEAAGTTMDEIVRSAGRVSSLVADIAQACREQLSGIEQVNGALARMEEHTQRNASLVESSARDANTAASDARTLVDLVAQFRLAEVQSVEVLPAASRAPRLTGGKAER